MNHLINAYGHHLNHKRDHEAAMDLLVGLMGYPRPYPGNWEATAEMFLADEARTLAEADLYVLAPTRVKRSPGAYAPGGPCFGCSE